MEAEIREQTSVLAHGARAYFPQLRSALEGRKFDMILLAARGSSDNAALFGRYLFEVHLGIPVSLAAPSVWTRFDAKVRYTNCLAVGVSQSGAAPDVAEVISALRADGHTTLGITNTAGSRLTQEAEFSLDLEAGLEKSIAATKTYSASLLSMYELARALGAPIPAPSDFLPGDDWMATAEAAALEASGAVVRCTPTFALGRGYGFSTALETSLKLMECALIPAKAYSSADFEHGPKALAGHGSAAISYDGPLKHLSEYGCEVIEAPAVDVPAEIKPFYDTIFAQWLALAASRARGLDPDGARHLKKVTETV